MDITYPQILVTESEIPTEILITSVTFLVNNNLTKLIDPNFQKVRNKREMNNEENFKDIDKVPVWNHVLNFNEKVVEVYEKEIIIVEIKNVSLLFDPAEVDKV